VKYGLIFVVLFALGQAREATGMNNFNRSLKCLCTLAGAMGVFGLINAAPAIAKKALLLKQQIEQQIVRLRDPQTYHWIKSQGGPWIQKNLWDWYRLAKKTKEITSKTCQEIDMTFDNWTHNKYTSVKQEKTIKPCPEIDLELEDWTNSKYTFLVRSSWVNTERLKNLLDKNGVPLDFHDDFYKSCSLTNEKVPTYEGLRPDDQLHSIPIVYILAVEKLPALINTIPCDGIVPCRAWATQDEIKEYFDEALAKRKDIEREYEELYKESKHYSLEKKIKEDCETMKEDREEYYVYAPRLGPKTLLEKTDWYHNEVVVKCDKQCPQGVKLAAIGIQKKQLQELVNHEKKMWESESPHGKQTEISGPKGSFKLSDGTQQLINQLKDVCNKNNLRLMLFDSWVTDAAMADAAKDAVKYDKKK